MTAEKLLEGCGHDGSYIPVGEVKKLMKEYAKLMCDKQKGICSEEVSFNADYYEMPYGAHCSIDILSITNASYPEELL